MDTILVVVEQREGKLNRVSWETIAAGQAIAAQTGWTLEAAVVGSGVAAIAGEVAEKKVGKVYDVESARVGPTRRHTLCRPSSPLPRPRSQLRPSPPPRPPASIQSERQSPAQPQSSPTRRGSAFLPAVQRLQE